MKKATLVLAAAAIVGIGSAFTTKSTSGDTPNVRNTAAFGDPDLWISIDPNNPGSCDEGSERDCLGYRATPTSNPTVLAHGDYSE